MTRPYSLFKKSNGYYYVQFLLADGSRSQNKSIAMRWAVLGDIPERINSKAEKAKSQSVDRISFFNSMSTYDFSPEEIDKMISIMQKRGFINGIVESITTPLKWAMKKQYIENITFFREHGLLSESFHQVPANMIQSFKTIPLNQIMIF